MSCGVCVLFVYRRRAQGKKPTWATLAPSRNPALITTQHVPDAVLGTAYSAAVALNWTILDRHSVARSLLRYYMQPGQPGDRAVLLDNVHYIPYINHEWNQLLLNMWC